MRSGRSEIGDPIEKLKRAFNLMTRQVSPSFSPMICAASSPHGSSNQVRPTMVCEIGWATHTSTTTG